MTHSNHSSREFERSHDRYAWFFELDRWHNYTSSAIHVELKSFGVNEDQIRRILKGASIQSREDFDSVYLDFRNLINEGIKIGITHRNMFQVIFSGISTIREKVVARRNSIKKSDRWSVLNRMSSLPGSHTSK